MEKHWNYFLFMLWLTYLIVSSILLFSKGFLLTRSTQEQNSTCSTLNKNLCNDDHNDECYDIYENSNELNNICMPQKARIILLIVDALRYDFTIYNRNLEDVLPYQNKLPIIDRLLDEQPEFTRLYKFIADPPTTTMQRLKALTTGSLPTFIDAGSNFATPEITEDNIIDQILHMNRSAVFMGDDTWTGLFPNRFIRQFPYPSFNVWDLDTVDNGVRNHLFYEMNRTDWSLLIGHFLGVDHCGHRYGPNHPEMARKLTEINDVITNVTRLMGDDTVLFVIGDHGMTSNGDHGGESSDEINAAFFAYTKLPLFKYQHVNKTRIVKQIGIVPTISTILGIPIPFSNLGTIILDSLPIWDNWRLLLHSLWSNVLQMMNYIEEYSRHNPDTFPPDNLDNLKEKFQILSIKLRTISTRSKFEEFYIECDEFLTNLRRNCEDVWIKFDSFSMTRGLLFLFLSVFFIYVITDGIPVNRLPDILNSSFLFCSFTLILIACGISAILYYFDVVNNLISTIFFSTGLVSQLMLVVLVVQNWELISLNWYDRSHKERFSNILTRLLLIFNLCSLFSNSFIMEESFMLLFLLNTVIIIIGSLNIVQKDSKKRFDYKPKLKLICMALILATIVRCSMLFWQCREEQQWCFEKFYTFKWVSSKSETTKLQWLFTVICLGLFITFTKIWLRNCGNLNGYSITITLFKYIPTVIVVCISGYWVLNRLPINTRSKLIKPWQINLLVWIVYGTAIIGVITTILKPLCIYIFNDRKVSTPTNENLIPQLFKHVKKLMNEPEQIPVICGLGTVYSSVYIIISVYLTLLVVLLQGDAIAPSSIIMYVTSCFIIVISSTIRLERAETIDGLFEIPNIYILNWMILAHYFFYGTGHQPSFPNITWNAGFIGITDIVSTNNLLPAILILIHTFSSFILIGFMVPLLIIVPFTVAVMLPSIVKRTILNEDNLRGEVVLYEKQRLFITAIFTLCCKYIMCHAIRVFASMLAATIHCRHLMVWNIFAPKFIFESIGMFVTLFIVNIAYLLLIRVNYKMGHLLVQLNRKYN